MQLLVQCKKRMFISTDIVNGCVMMQPEWKNNSLHNE